MLKIIFVIISLFFLSGCADKEENKTKELIILGSVHFPTSGINSDSIYFAIKKVKPEVILMERDSVSFDSAFNRKVEYEENEDQAVTRFLEDNPNTILRPIEFEGRNSYRTKAGLYPQANDVYQKLNELSRSSKFTPEESLIWSKFANYWVQLDSLSSTNLKALNNDKTDVIMDSAKYYQYTKMKNIVNDREEFNEQILDSKGDSISLVDYFNKWEQFEHYDRNDAMVSNIIRTIEHLPNKRIMLIVGYHHRYYIKEALERKAPHIKLIEFYE
ncbi:MAG: hypothetical protein HWE15_13145 [Algoriphagus sp.]|uniref:hypothetical protein n=1 Tax=Algoriphagus sp. TaxID=1872435 RepID=UPI00184143F1|nr:hypothetical protein [Algoriphagus sp.]NVJ87251.1 hypothetical protein [Algoriphagus sp.]